MQKGKKQGKSKEPGEVTRAPAVLLGDSGFVDAQGVGAADSAGPFVPGA